MNPADATSDGARWLSTSQAAAALRCSQRTIRRRCKAGEIAARFENGVWEVNAADIGHADTNVDTTRGQSVTQSDRILSVNEVKGADNRTSNAVKRTDGQTDTRPRGHGQGDSDRSEIEAELRAQLAREREFCAILKVQLEAVTQSEAQTKAALREALRAMPKQLTAGGEQSFTSLQLPGTEPETAQIGEVEPKPEHPKVPGGAPKRQDQRGAGLALVRDGLRQLLGGRNKDRRV